MIEIKHARATLKVKPENAQAAHDLLALIDKSKGKRGPKLERPKGMAKNSSTRRDYPVFFAGMTTEDYISRYAGLNARLCLKGWDHTHALGKAAPTLDLRFPEVVEEPNE